MTVSDIIVLTVDWPSYSNRTVLAIPDLIFLPISSIEVGKVYTQPSRRRGYYRCIDIVTKPYLAL